MSCHGIAHPAMVLHILPWHCASCNGVAHRARVLHFMQHIFAQHAVGSGFYSSKGLVFVAEKNS